MLQNLHQFSFQARSNIRKTFLIEFRYNNFHSLTKIAILSVCALFNFHAYN